MGESVESMRENGISHEAVELGTKTTARTLRVDQIYSRKDHNVHFVPTSRSSLLTKQRKFGKYALVIRRIIDKNGKIERTEVDVKSLPLRDVLLEINKNVEGLELHKTPPQADPKLFYHSYLGLESRLEQERASSSPDEDLINDLSEAIAYTKEDFGPSIDSIKSLVAKEEITFEYLWALFRPGTILYTELPTLQGVPELLLLRGGHYSKETFTRDKGYWMQCWTLSHDGKNFGLSAPTHDVFISIFLGSRAITELPIYPFNYHPDKEQLRAALIEQGREFVNLVKKPSYKEYTGSGVKEIDRGSEKPELRKFLSKGRVMIDPITFIKYNTCSHLTPPVRRVLKIDSLTDEDLLICTPLVPGFGFGSKCWGSFAISSLREIEWNSTAFDKLVLNPQHSKFVLALVKAHSSGTNYFDDIVQNKGRGLIGLLSGPPGVGKTLTAEAVAEVTQRPLYILSAGELGTDPESLDENLNLVLELGDRWNSILLLDEADAFLHERQARELKRNSLVSIFLRQLEYYQGIMILTTNRVDAIDGAFHSRIHFSIDYPELDKASRSQIWNIFICNIQASTGKSTPDSIQTLSSSKSTDMEHRFSISDAEISELAENDLNGRQIKNTIASAVSLAHDEGVPLNISHIKVVLDVMSDFAIAVKGKGKEPRFEEDLVGLL